MSELYESFHLLLISASETFLNKLSSLLEKEDISAHSAVKSIAEAKLVLIERDVDLLILDAPLPSEDALLFAMDMAKSKAADYSIIILTGAELYEQNLYQTERMGIVSFKKPMDPRLLLQTIRLLISMRMKIKKLQSKADKLAEKLEDDRIIGRAKLLLVTELRMSEADAHRYIEKKSMDACVKKTEIARDIMRRYDGMP